MTIIEGTAFSFRIAAGTAPTHRYIDEPFKRRGFATHPKFPLRNHFDLWRSTQSITSTTPTIPPLSVSNGTEIPCFLFTN
jgi:hypothetical protein